VIDIVDAHVTGACDDARTVVIAGGGLSSCDHALELAMAGKDVTVVEMTDRVAAEFAPINRDDLIEQLQRYGVRLLVDSRVAEFTDGGVRVRTGGSEPEDLEADAVVTSFGAAPHDALADRIFHRYPTSRIVGDCSQVGRIGEAVRDGFFAGWSI